MWFSTACRKTDTIRFERSECDPTSCIRGVCSDQMSRSIIKLPSYIYLQSYFAKRVEVLKAPLCQEYIDICLGKNTFDALITAKIHSCTPNFNNIGLRVNESLSLRHTSELRDKTLYVFLHDVPADCMMQRD